MIDELVIATSVLAGFTAILAFATIAYAWYTRQQVKLLAVGHELTKTGHELTKTQIAVEVVAARVSAHGPFDLDQRIREEKQRLGFAEKKDEKRKGWTA